MSQHSTIDGEIPRAELYAWQLDVESGRNVTPAERACLHQAQSISQVASDERFEAEIVAGTAGWIRPVNLPEPASDEFDPEPDHTERTTPFPIGTGLAADDLDIWRAELTGRAATNAELRAFAFASEHLAATSAPAEPAGLRGQALHARLVAPPVAPLSGPQMATEVHRLEEEIDEVARTVRGIRPSQVGGPWQADAPQELPPDARRPVEWELE